MTAPRTIAILAMVAVAVLGAAVPATTPVDAQSADGAANGLVTVGVGQQLSTIIAVTSSDARSDYEEAAFEFELETDAGNESARAATIADRAEVLLARAADIQADYENATAAYEAGELSHDEYARELASLNARATTLQADVDALLNRTDDVSRLELRAEGVSTAELREASGTLDAVTGAGPRALLLRFLGERTGEIELETADGLSIEANSEDGEHTRELRRDRDDDDAMTVNGSAALATARDALSTQDGTWRLTESSVHPEDGYYKYEFSLQTDNATGEAEIRVDGSTGEVFRLEEEIETDDDRDHGEDDREDDGDEGEHDDIAVLLASGTPAPGETITVQVVSNGSAVANATVTLNDAVVGETAADGTIAITLPDGEAEIEARANGEDGELEFEFEDEDDEDGDIHRALDVTVDVTDGSALVTVTYDGAGVEDARVAANGDVAGTTDADGTVTVAIPNGTDELELEIEKGEFESELTFAIDGSSVTLVEAAHEPADGDDDAEEEHDEVDDENEEDEDDHEDADDVDGDDEGEEDDDDDDGADDDDSGSD